MTNLGIPGTELSRILDSISSPYFSLLALDVGDREKCFVKDGKAPTKRYLGDMRAVSRSLQRLATRMFERTGKRFTLMLLGNNPALTAIAFSEFQKVGQMWEGERSIGNARPGYYWTFQPAKGCEAEGVDEDALDFVTR